MAEHVLTFVLMQLIMLSSYVLIAELQDLLPGIINQLGPDNLSHLKKIAQQVSLHTSAL